MNSRSSQTPFNLTTLAVGHLYLTCYGELAPRHLLVHNHLIDSVSAGQTPIWITDKEPHRALDNSELSTQLSASIQGKKVQVLLAEMTGTVDHLLGEIDYYARPRGQLVIIEHFQRYALVAQQEGITRSLISMRNWAEERQCIVLTCAPESALETLFSAGAGVFSGIALLTYQGTQLSWIIHYWLSTRHMVTQRTVALTQATNQQLLTDASTFATIMPEQPSGQAYDTHRVVIARAALGEQILPIGWELINHHHEITPLISEVVACTFILAFTKFTPLEELAHLIYGLRRAGGSLISIVVREIGRHLRSSEESLLYQMGTSLVIPAEVSFARMLGLLSSQQGQVYSRPMPATFESLWQASVLPSIRGYLPPARFADHVKQSLTGAKMPLNQAIMVQFQLLPELRHSEPQTLMNIGRHGDIYTMIEDQLYLYLHTCQPTHLSRVLDQLLQRPVEEVALTHKRLITTDAMQVALSDLSLAVNHIKSDENAITPQEPHSLIQEGTSIRHTPVPSFAYPHPLSVKLATV